jgi:hypothetical protein
MAPIVILPRPIETGRGGAIAQLGERIVRNDEVGGSIPPGSTNLRRQRRNDARRYGRADIVQADIVQIDTIQIIPVYIDADGIRLLRKQYPGRYG